VVRACLEMAHVSFEVACRTQIGDRLLVTGNSPQLGHWTPELSSVELFTEACCYPLWYGFACLEPDTDLQFKVVVLSLDGRIKWEDHVPNRCVRLGKDNLNFEVEFDSPSLKVTASSKVAADSLSTLSLADTDEGPATTTENASEAELLDRTMTCCIISQDDWTCGGPPLPDRTAAEEEELEDMSAVVTPRSPWPPSTTQTQQQSNNNNAAEDVRCTSRSSGLAKRCTKRDRNYPMRMQRNATRAMFMPMPR